MKKRKRTWVVRDRWMKKEEKHPARVVKPHLAVPGVGEGSPCSHLREERSLSLLHVLILPCSRMSGRFCIYKK